MYLNSQVLVQYFFRRIPAFLEFVFVRVTPRYTYTDDIIWETRIDTHSDFWYRIFVSERIFYSFLQIGDFWYLILVCANPALQN